jgi:hypothetical protein
VPQRFTTGPSMSERTRDVLHFVVTLALKAFQGAGPLSTSEKCSLQQKTDEEHPPAWPTCLIPEVFIVADRRAVGRLDGGREVDPSGILFEKLDALPGEEDVRFVRNGRPTRL